MKRFHRRSALLLVLTMLLSLILTGCGKKEPPVPADQVAEAMFDILIKNDFSKAVEAFGYASEADAVSDWGGGEERLNAEVLKQALAEFSNMGYKITNEEMQTYYEGLWKMLKNTELTAKVKVSDEEAGVAVVTCTVNTVDSDEYAQVMADAANELDPYLFATGDVEEHMGQILSIAAAGISELKPTDRTVDFDVDFELSEMDVNGKTRQVWVPKDTKEFGYQITYNICGG